MRLTSRALVALISVATLAGCTGRGSADGGDSAQASESESAPDLPGIPADTEIERTADVTAQVRVAVSGHVTVDWTGEQVLRLVRVGGPTLDVNHLSLGLLEPLRDTAQPRHRFRWAFDLIGEYQDRPGTFTIPATPEGPPKVQSAAFLMWLVVHPEAAGQPQIYDEAEAETLTYYSRVASPCQLDVGEEERHGRLHCPQLADDEGNVVSLEVSWRDGRMTPVKDPPSEANPDI